MSLFYKVKELSGGTELNFYNLIDLKGWGSEVTVEKLDICIFSCEKKINYPTFFTVIEVRTTSFIVRAL